MKENCANACYSTIMWIHKPVFPIVGKAVHQMSFSTQHILVGGILQYTWSCTYTKEVPSPHNGNLSSARPVLGEIHRTLDWIGERAYTSVSLGHMQRGHTSCSCAGCSTQLQVFTPKNLYKTLHSSDYSIVLNTTVIVYSKLEIKGVTCFLMHTVYNHQN